MNNAVISISSFRKSHALVLLGAIAVGSATATVEVRDNLDIFSDLSMQGNRITDLETLADDQDAATKKYVDESGRVSVFYGDSSDGQITDSSSKNRGGIIHATTYTLEQGGTVSLNKQYPVIKATESITVNGKIDGKAASKNGEKGGVDGGNYLTADDGSAGGPSAFTPVGVSGGYGGADTVEGIGANNPVGMRSGWERRYFKPLSDRYTPIGAGSTSNVA